MYLASLSLLLGLAHSSGMAYYLYGNNEIELGAPFPDDKLLPLFKKAGAVDMDKTVIHLTDGKENEQGALWSKRVMSEKGWQAIFAFRMKGDAIGGNGLAFWYTKEGGRTGPVYGGPDRFDGFGLFLDTFDEETKSETIPMVVGMLGDGQTPFKLATAQGAKSGKIVGSCFKALRNTESPVYVRVTYFQKHLKVEIDATNEGNAYGVCFEHFDIDLPVGNYIGLSASTNAYPDHYELYALKTGVFSTIPRHADPMEEPKNKLDYPERAAINDLSKAILGLFDKHAELIGEFRAVVGVPAKDQLPFNNRLEVLERDIRHLDNHLDRTEESLHALTILVKKVLQGKETAKQSASKVGTSTTAILDNIKDNLTGYLVMLGIQALIVLVALTFAKSGTKQGPIQRKAL